MRDFYESNYKSNLIFKKKTPTKTKNNWFKKKTIIIYLIKD